jgi:hypothetical protein
MTAHLRDIGGRSCTPARFSGVPRHTSYEQWGFGVLAHLGDAVAFDADHQAVLVVGTTPAANRNCSRRR